MPCVERVSRLKPSVSSSSFMCLLTTDGVVRRSAAALVKLRRSATRTKVLSLFRSRSAAVKDIVLSAIKALTVPASPSYRGPLSRKQQLFRQTGYQIPGLCLTSVARSAKQPRVHSFQVRSEQEEQHAERISLRPPHPLAERRVGLRVPDLRFPGRRGRQAGQEWLSQLRDVESGRVWPASCD